MARILSKDTRLCMSLSGRPGNFGTRFHNALYDLLELDYIYKAFTTTDLPAAIGGVRALGIRGCAVSMPFKEACIPYLDALDPSAAVIGSVNTIVNDEGHLTGYNTDYLAVASLVRSHAVDPTSTLLLRGSGGMGKAVAVALRDSGFARGTLAARNALAGQGLAQACGYGWVPSAEGHVAQVLVNVTPLGMDGGPEAGQLAFSAEQVAAAEVVFDVVAIPVETPLIRLARSLGKRVITGGEVIVLQAVEQFVLYTGVRPTPEQIRQAEAVARA